jgi:hypothetical protein
MGVVERDLAGLLAGRISTANLFLSEFSTFENV